MAGIINEDRIALDNVSARIGMLVSIGKHVDMRTIEKPQSELRVYLPVAFKSISNKGVGLDTNEERLSSP